MPAVQEITTQDITSAEVRRAGIMRNAVAAGNKSTLFRNVDNDNNDSPRLSVVSSGRTGDAMTGIHCPEQTHFPRMNTNV